VIAATIIIVVLAATAAAFYLTIRKQPTKWVYHGVVIPATGNIYSIKDPEFVRYPNHTVFKDDEGFYYIVASYFKTDNTSFTGVIKTKDLLSYEFVCLMPSQMDGKIAPYCIYNPDDGRFYLYYSDWKNTIDYNRTRHARLGLAVGTNIKNPSTFTDYGYLTIENMPEPLAPNLGWDPYIVKMEDTYYMLISAAKYEIHLATAKNLGTRWNYTKIAVTGTLENPTLFHLNAKWYMMVGIYNGTCYNLYESYDLKYWNVVEKNFFQDENYSELPAGSTSIIANDTFYHLYQVHLGQGHYQLSLAYIKVEDLIVEIAKNK
jgi:sucrose-6-phosphate hydrolase SacC (GH32 family)